MLIEEIRVQGYKSLVDATLHMRPLTLLAGTNSSGKSSIMQPLLLIKQTIEASYQPAGALVLDGAHVQAETAGELVSKVNQTKSFSIKIQEKDGPKYKEDIELAYKVDKLGFSVLYQNSPTYLFGHPFSLTPDMPWADIEAQFDNASIKFFGQSADFGKVVSASAFLKVQVFEGEHMLDDIDFSFDLSTLISNLMHIPGLRVIPKRSYPTTLFKNQIKGTFDVYAAGTVSQWQQQGNTQALMKLNDYLRRLGLTDSVTAKVKNANEVELNVSRLPAGSKGKPRKADMVNIADVGIGVSQVLPILVALIAAQEGQIVYVEQPELHLHPRAQVAMAELLAEAANRGVRVIVETHSSLLLLTVQTLIAQERIKNTDVALHWFARDAKGATQVTYMQPDEDGAYREWPEDFGDVELKAQDAYLTAVGLRHFGNAAK
jgi:predicted ATPase